MARSKERSVISSPDEAVVLSLNLVIMDVMVNVSG